MKLVAILLVLLPVVAVIAILVRRHFSLHKDGSWAVPEIAGRLQKLEVLYGRSLEDATAQYVEQRFRQFLAGLGLLWILGLGVLLLPSEDKDSSGIQRPAAGEDAAGITVQLTDGDKEEEFTLSVGSRQMTEEEFEAAVSSAGVSLEKEILGGNSSLDFVTENLVFPKKDPEGLLKISWDTDALTIISRNGTVRRDNLEEACSVTIRAELSDGIRERTVSFCATVVPKSYTETKVERVQRILAEMEEGSRADETFTLPDQVDGVVVKEKSNTTGKMICKLYPVIVLTAGVFFFLRGSREKEKLKQREEILQSVFYRFVKRLTLLIYAGASLGESLLTAAAVEEQFLTPEVRYAVNRIGTGSSESGIYAELGRHIGLRCYIRLFSTISTAAPRGSSQLLTLLEQEVQDAEAETKEAARRKGEQVSQKLLLPMILLLAVVVGIVLYPAIAGM